MFKLIGRFIDRILFTICFVIGVQAPEFIQQYIQRLSGHLNEVEYQLKQFQTIADIQFKGDLTALIHRYQANSDPAIHQTGDVVANMVDRIDHFQWQLSQLKDNGYVHKLYHFITDVDINMAKATLTHYQLAIPLELGALVTGLIFALIIVATEYACISTVTFGTTKIKKKLTSRKLTEKEVQETKEV